MALCARGYLTEKSTPSWDIEEGTSEEVTSWGMSINWTSKEKQDSKLADTLQSVSFILSNADLGSSPKPHAAHIFLWEVMSLFAHKDPLMWVLAGEGLY